MAVDITEAIKAVGEALTSLFNWLKSNKEGQCETQIVKDKNRLKKATNIAEDIFRLIDDNKSYLPEDVVNKYDKLRKKFDNKD